MNRSLVIAHRGASGYRPENTLTAFELAVAQRADMIETDLHRTADGAIVVTHDDDLASLGGCGSIAQATLAQVRAFDVGGGESAPTLEEVLDRFGARIPWNLELKRGSRGEYPGLEATTLDAVRARGLVPDVLFSSFHDTVLARLRALAPEARVGLLLSRRAPERAIERALSLAAEAIHPEAPLVDAALIRTAHAAGLAVYVFTVDDPAEMRRLVDLGADGLFTNFPDRMRRLVDSPRG